MTVAAIFFALSVSAQEVKENSSDTRLMKNVVTLGVLENGMVIHDWEWNDTARQLSSKYGLSVEEGGYPSDGLIAQDVEAIYPDAVVVDADGYLVIDIPMLAEQDELIAKMVMEGGADVVGEPLSYMKWTGTQLLQPRIEDRAGTFISKRKDLMDNSSDRATEGAAPLAPDSGIGYESIPPDVDGPAPALLPPEPVWEPPPPVPEG